MSSRTRELIEVLISLSPWLAFLVALAWSTVAYLWDDASPKPGATSGRSAPTARQEEPRPR